MKKPKKLPAPAHILTSTFKKYNKKYKVDIKIFENHQNLVDYYNYSTYDRTTDLLAAAIFYTPNKDNNNLLGEMIFSKGVISPAIIAHEAAHIAFQYFEQQNATLKFEGRRKEETFCDIIQILTDDMFEYMAKHDIKYKIKI